MTKDEDVVVALNLVAARHAKPPRDPNKQYAYRLVHFDDLRPGTKSASLVAGVIPRAGLVAVWGPPKCGKSFWTFDLVMHIALGWAYRGLRVVQGPVVYLAFEGAEGFNNRAEAFRRTHEIEDRPWFYLLGSNAKLVRDHKALIDSIDGQTDRPPTCVVLDTLNRSIDGSESKDADMGAYLAAAEAIVEEFDCVVIIVHHCGIDATRPRGHTSLTGAVDAQISVKRDAAGNVVVEVEAMKDGAEGATFVSALQVITVGTDDDGQEITSCAIVEVAAAGTKPKAKLSQVATAALRVLHECLADLGRKPPPSAHIPQGVTSSVTLTEWRDYLFKHSLINKDGGYREQFRRLHVTLKNAGAIGIWDENVWTVA
jgi:hypothetical protein